MPLETSARKEKWWKLDEKDIHGGIVGALTFYDQKQLLHSSEIEQHIRLYSGRNFLGLRPDQHLTNSDSMAAEIDGLRENVIQEIVDTQHASLSVKKPVMRFLTEEGNWDEARKAEKLTRLVKGVFLHQGAYVSGSEAGLDGLTTGTGHVKILPGKEKNYRTGKIRSVVEIERVLPGELVVDHEEGLYGRPRQLFQRKWLSREEVVGMFPKKESAIMEAARAASKNTRTMPRTDTLADQIEVVEAWHLDSGKGDGAVAIIVNGVTLMAEEWLKGYFPFAFFRHHKRQFGFWGQGLPERIKGLQIEKNKTSKRIAKIVNRMAVPRVYMQNQAKVPKAHFSNEIGQIITYSGQIRPTIDAAPTVPPELFGYRADLKESMFQQTGTSQLSASALKPSGLDAAVALREFQDIESRRFAVVEDAYSEFYKEIARQTIEVVKDIAEKDEDFTSRYEGDEFIETIRWSEINLDDDAYIMQTWPTNLLPSTPTGQLQTAQELSRDGFLTKEQSLDLLNFPDLKATTSLMLAPIQDIKRTIANFEAGRKFELPEPFQNLELGMQMMQSAYLRARNKNAPESVLANMQKWIKMARDMDREAKAAAFAEQQAAALQQQGGLPGGAPPAGGAPQQIETGLPVPQGQAPDIDSIQF